MNEINEKNNERTVLESSLKRLKSRKYIYMPVMDDEVDQRLGEELNQLDDPQGFGSLVKRESPGIYSFGTKKVFAKIENGKLISMFIP